jgi:phage tail-like protein
MNLNARAWATRLLVLAIALVAVVAVNAQNDQRKAPFAAYYFEVEINGVIYPFRSCSGLKIETEVVEYQEGGNTGFVRKMPGVTRYSNIRLSRGFTGDRFLYDLYLNAKKPNPSRINGRIIMVDRQGTQIAAWKFFNGFPVKWEGPDFDASKNEIAIETIEIAHEGLTLSSNDDN